MYSRSHIFGCVKILRKGVINEAERELQYYQATRERVKKRKKKTRMPRVYLENPRTKRNDTLGAASSLFRPLSRQRAVLICGACWGMSSCACPPRSTGTGHARASLRFQFLALLDGLAFAIVGGSGVPVIGVR